MTVQKMCVLYYCGFQHLDGVSSLYLDWGVSMDGKQLEVTRGSQHLFNSVGQVAHAASGTAESVIVLAEAEPAQPIGLSIEGAPAPPPTCVS